MKKDRLRKILGEWLDEHAKAVGGVTKLAEMTGIKHPQISTAISEASVSWGMLAKISETPEMSMARIFDQLAAKCTAAERAATSSPPTPPTLGPEGLRPTPIAVLRDADRARRGQVRAKKR